MAKIGGLWWTAASACLLVGLGCSSGTPTPTAVHGKVLYKEQPLKSGTIVFAPDARHGGSGPLMSAEIRKDGTYELAGQSNSSIQPGWYRVTVVAVEPGVANAGGRFMVPRSLVPERYRDPESSGLCCEVVSGKKNGINFFLE